MARGRAWGAIAFGRIAMTALVASAFAGALTSTPVQAAAPEQVRVEFHYKPVPRLQIAIWLEDGHGGFLRDVMVTQAIGKLGIGNRPGRRDFLSSWRAPYGERPSALPIWSHRRGKTYPKLRFHDDDPGDQDSLGWHENTSSAESFFCRPLTPDENGVISLDTMTCPSPASFRSDKGRFDGGITSVYPPRNDITAIDTKYDHADVRMFRTLNDLDAVTAATPAGDAPEFVSLLLPLDPAIARPWVAWIEVGLERDENPSYEFTREDHYIDPRLSSYGVEYFGQPSVVYRVEFDPMLRGVSSTNTYYGYGDFDGATGTIHPPDETISTGARSGADRLQSFELNEMTFRFAVFSHGVFDGPDDDTGGWGTCTTEEVDAFDELELEPLDFDTVRMHFTVPDDLEPAQLKRVRLYYRTGDTRLTSENLDSAIEVMPADGDCAPMTPGERSYCDVRELFGNYVYQMGIRYEDTCNNESALVAEEVRTPRQQFTQIESFCFIATAAYGAPWMHEVNALRWFRDLYLRRLPLGPQLVEFYYAYSPTLAEMIQRQPLARAMVRVALQPVADLARLATGV